MNEILQLIGPAKPVFDLACDAVIITDLSGNIGYVNPAFCALFSYRKSDVLRKNCTVVCKNNSITLSEIIRDLPHAQTISKNLECENADGTQLYFKSCFSIFHGKNHLPAGVIITLKQENLTPEEEIRNLENQGHLLRALNYRTDEMFTLSDVKDRKYLIVSNSSEKIIGWSATEILDGGWAFFLSLLHPEDYNYTIDMFLKEVNRRNTEKPTHDHVPIDLNYRLRHKNGSFVSMHTEAIIIERDEQGLIRYLLSFCKETIIKKNNEENFSQNLLKSIFNGSFESTMHTANHNGSYSTSIYSQLSSREKEILKMIKDGNSTKEISTSLKLTVNTINTYRKNLMQKLRAKNAAELVRIAIEHKIS